MRWVVTLLLIVVLIAVGVFAARYFDLKGMLWPTDVPATDDEFSMVKENNPRFAEAVNMIASNRDIEEARRILEEEVARAESEDDEGLAGVARLWLAISSVSLTNTENESAITSYVEQMTAIATNESYTSRTRTYAYAYLANLFLQLAAVGRPEDLRMLDPMFKHPAHALFLVKDADGALDHRASVVNILEASADIGENPLVHARTASILAKGVEIGWDAGAAEKRLREAVSLLNRASLVEDDLRQSDTAPFYPIYLFLRAQTYAATATLLDGKLASEITVDIPALFDQALQASLLGQVGAEASIRYGYAKYLVESHVWDDAVADATEREALTARVEPILRPFAERENLRNTALFDVLLKAKSVRTTMPSQYETLVEVSEYSPSFKALLSEQGALE